MAYTQISGVVSKTNSNMGVMSFEIDGKPVTIKGLQSNQILDGHNIIVAGKQKDSGFQGIGFYDKTNGTTFKSVSQTMGWPVIMIGSIIILGGLGFLGIFVPLAIIIIAAGGYYIWNNYIVANKYIDSLKKGEQK